mgnify:CR=1 FL=1
MLCRSYLIIENPAGTSEACSELINLYYIKHAVYMQVRKFITDAKTRKSLSKIQAAMQHNFQSSFYSFTSLPAERLFMKTQKKRIIFIFFFMAEIKHKN